MKITQERDLITVDSNGARVELVGESYEQAIDELKRITDMSFGAFAMSITAVIVENSLTRNQITHAFAKYTAAWAKRDELSEIGVDL